MDALVHTFRANPDLAIFLTLALGFGLGSVKIGTFSLGVVTSTLLAGVLVGQMNIPISADMKAVFFLMFLFAVGYAVGPQFFSGLKSDGLQLALLGLVLCVSCLLVTYLVAKVAGLNPGQAAGLLAGACTISAVVGVATGVIGDLALPPEARAAFIAAVPVAYAVTYLFGTVGSAWILAQLGPRILGANLPEECARYEKEMGVAKPSTGESIYTRFVARAHRVTGVRFVGRTVGSIEEEFSAARLFLPRLRAGSQIQDTQADTVVPPDSTVVVLGRRETLLDLGTALGPEVDDRELLDFPGETLDVVLTNTAMSGKTLSELATAGEGHLARGVFLRRLLRGGREMPFLPNTKVERGDVLQIAGPARAVAHASAALGYADRATEKTDMLFMGLGIVAGGLIGSLTLNVGGVPLSLTTSGGALIAGLVCGWLRSVHRTFGRIPEPALWVFNNVGLNVFIAAVGISSGPTFVAGLKDSGLTLLLSGVVVTTVPFIVALLFGKYVLKMNPAILLGACAGARATTAALGALEEAAHSHVPSFGYTVPYAVGNVLLITWGVVIVTLMA